MKFVKNQLHPSLRLSPRPTLQQKTKHVSGNLDCNTQIMSYTSTPDSSCLLVRVRFSSPLTFDLPAVGVSWCWLKLVLVAEYKASLPCTDRQLGGVTTAVYQRIRCDCVGGDGCDRM